MSHMAREAAEAPEAVARFLERNGQALTEIGARLKRKPPPSSSRRRAAVLIMRGRLFQISRRKF